MDHEKTGALIRKLRTEKGLTQRALAERLHVSDKAVSKWERGHSVCVITPLLGAQWARTQSAVQLTHSEFTRASWYSSVQPRTVLWTYYIIIPVHISSPVSSSAPIIPIKEDSIYSS